MVLIQRIVRTAVSVAAVSMLTACAHSSNMGVGQEPFNKLGLEEQRKALTAVKVVATVPAGATVLGEVDASRCHRRFTETAPNELTVVTDLRIAAYGRGADGIAEVKVEKRSALTSNCWYALDGRATAFSNSR